jgi:hypothetical protein
MIQINLRKNIYNSVTIMESSFLIACFFFWGKLSKTKEKSAWKNHFLINQFSPCSFVCCLMRRDDVVMINDETN